jgi:hypothetical protein
MAMPAVRVGLSPIASSYVVAGAGLDSNQLRTSAPGRGTGASQSVDAIVKPGMQPIKIGVLPKRPDSQPTGAVMIAAAAMEEVSIPVIPSKLPRANGNATFAMV